MVNRCRLELWSRQSLRQSGLRGRDRRHHSQPVLLGGEGRRRRATVHRVSLGGVGSCAPSFKFASKRDLVRVFRYCRQMYSVRVMCSQPSSKRCGSRVRSTDAIPPRRAATPALRRTGSCRVRFALTTPGGPAAICFRASAVISWRRSLEACRKPRSSRHGTNRPRDSPSPGVVVNQALVIRLRLPTFPTRLARRGAVVVPTRDDAAMHRDSRSHRARGGRSRSARRRRIRWHRTDDQIRPTGDERLLDGYFDDSSQ